MAVGTLGTNANTSLSAITFNVNGATTSTTSHTLSAADLAAIAASITGDGHFAATNPTGILATGSTHTNTTLDTLSATAGGPLATIQIGDLVLGVGIPPGTFVVAKPSGTSVTLSQAATASASIRVGIIPVTGQSNRLSFNQLLSIPGRGVIKVLPGDIVAIDNTGWPIVVSAASIAYAGSLWHLV